MKTGLSGGLPTEFEYFLAACPDNPEMRDSATLWVMPDSGSLAFPRITIDAIGSAWDHPWLQLNLVLSDGRAFRLWSAEENHSVIDASGNTSVLGAGPLRFHCIEPFRHWQVTFKGQVEETTTLAQMAGDQGGKLVDLAFQIDAEMAAPPWLMGGLSVEKASQILSADGSAIMGGLRYEQLCRLSGFVKIDAQQHRISGTGMRVRRQGVRNVSSAVGHCQHSALFPSGKAFGAISMAPSADGVQSFNEAFVYRGDGELIPARVVQAPWMTRLVASGDSADIVLESDIGTIKIEGETLLSTFDRNLFEMADSSILHQGVARYTWDGEQTIGLIERCSLRERIDIG